MCREHPVAVEAFRDGDARFVRIGSLARTARFADLREPGQIAVLQHQAYVRVRDQAAARNDHKSMTVAADADAGNDVPDRLETEAHRREHVASRTTRQRLRVETIPGAGGSSVG